MSVVSPRNGPTPSEEDNSLLWWIFGAIASKPESQNQPEIIKNSQKSQVVLPMLLQTPVYSSIGPQSHFSENSQPLPMSDVWRTTSNVLLSMLLQPPASRSLDSQSLIFRGFQIFPPHWYVLRATEETPVSRDIPCPVWPTPTPLFWVSSKQTPTTTYRYQSYLNI